MPGIEGYFGETCPRCLTWAGQGVETCPVCGYPVPLGYVIPYDDPPWEYSDELVALLRKYGLLRLMAKYAGRDPGRLRELHHCQRMYLSRYKGFAFASMESFASLESLELDQAPIEDVDGVQHLPALSILALTECRQLERIDALAHCPSVKSLSLALCNRVQDHSPIGKMTGLQELTLEARQLHDLEFLRTLPALRSIAVGLDKLLSADLEPLFTLDGLTHLAIRKKLTKKKDVERMHERWPGAEIVVD